MISLVLQKNASEEIVFDKKLTNVSTVTATLKRETDIVNPTFLLRVNSLPNFNYITCSNLGRSYFVRNITSVTGGLWEIVCECDVLSSYKTQIRANKAIVRRQEKDWNLYYNDGSFRTYQNPHIITKSFPNGFSPSNPTFVLAVAGGAEDITE